MEHISQKKCSKIIDTFNYIGISIDGIGEVHDSFSRGQKALMARECHKKSFKVLNWEMLWYKNFWDIKGKNRKSWFMIFLLWLKI